MRISIKNNSTTVALSATVTGVSPGGAIKYDSTNNGLISLVSGTNMVGNAAVDATFSEIYSQGAGVLAVTKKPYSLVEKLVW